MRPGAELRTGPRSGGATGSGRPRPDGCSRGRASLRSLSMSASQPPSDDGSPVDSGPGAPSIASGKSLKPGSRWWGGTLSWAAARGPGRGRCGPVHSAAGRGRAGGGQDHAAGGGSFAGHRFHLPAGRAPSPSPTRPCRAAGAAATRSATCLPRCPSPRPKRCDRRSAGPPSRRRLPTGSSSPRQRSPCWRRPPNAGPCWCSSTTCSGWTASRRKPSSSLRAGLAPMPSAFVMATRTGDAPAELRQGLPVLRLGGLSASDAAALLPAATAPSAWNGWWPAPGATRSPCWRCPSGWTTPNGSEPRPCPTHCRPATGCRGSTGPRLRLSPAPGGRCCCWRCGARRRPAACAGRASSRPPRWTRRGRTGVLVRDGITTCSGTRCCAVPSWNWPRPASSARPMRRWPTLSPPGTGHTSGTAPSPRSALDAEVADELAGVADADRDRLGYAAASAALERAGDFTPDPDLAARRLALAAHDAFMAGDVARVRAWSTRVLSRSPRRAPEARRCSRWGCWSSTPARSLGRSSTSTMPRHCSTGAARAGADRAGHRPFRLNDVAGLADCAGQIDAVADPVDRRAAAAGRLHRRRARPGR